MRQQLVLGAATRPQLVLGSEMDPGDRDGSGDCTRNAVGLIVIRQQWVKGTTMGP